MENVASARLQIQLDYWKDACKFCEVTFRAGLGYLPLDPESVPPPVLNAHTFDDVVFDNTITHLPLSAWGMTREQCDLFQYLSPFVRFPFEFFQWSRKSRRVFHLPAGLHRMLAAATFPDIRWSDVLMPFESFVITLEEPLRVEDTPGIFCEYDTILVARLSDKSISIRLMGPIAGPTSSARLSKDIFRRAVILGKQNPQKAELYLQKQWNTWMKNIAVVPGWRGTTIRRSDQSDSQRVALEPLDIAPAKDVAELRLLEGGLEEHLWEIEPLSWAAKIVVGWCLYLRSMHASDLDWEKPTESHRYKKSLRGLTGVITSPDYICSIVGQAVIDPSRYGVIERTGTIGSSFFVRPHWRRAHDKRPRGSPFGSPKSITIPPLLIRRDLVPLFGIIGGTKTKILSED